MRVFSLIRKQRLTPLQRRYAHHSLPTNSLLGRTAPLTTLARRSAMSTAQGLAGSTFKSWATSRIRTAPLLLP